MTPFGGGRPTPSFVDRRDDRSGRVHIVRGEDPVLRSGKAEGREVAASFLTDTESVEQRTARPTNLARVLRRANDPGGSAEELDLRHPDGTPAARLAGRG